MSSGIFVLEPMRRLIVSDDATGAIEPMHVRKRLLDLIASLGPNEMSFSAGAQVLDAIKQLHRDPNTLATTSGSPTSAQKPTHTLLYEEVITQIKTVIESKDMSISEGLSHAREEYRKVVEEAEILKCNLEEAKKHLKEATVKTCGAEEALHRVSESITLGNETGLSLVGMGKQAADEATEMSTNDELDTGRTRGTLAQSWANVCNAMSEFARDLQDGVKESREDDRRMRSERIREAEEKVEELEHRVAECERQKVKSKAFLDIFSGLCDLQREGGGEGGGEVDVPGTLRCSYIWDDAGTAREISRSL